MRRLPLPHRRDLLVWALAVGGSIVGSVRAAAQGIDVEELTVQQVEAGYASGEFTAVGLTRAFLDRIQRYEEHYNAFISMNPDALHIAAELDSEYVARGPKGPLHGVPVVIKDNIDYGGLVTTAGFEGFSAAAGGVDMIPDDDAAVVSRLKAAGAIILGKTNLPDFAEHGTRTVSTVAGVTLNPYNVEKVPGGSSGGTATAVNASFAVLGLGTETGGSIENPASAQGLVGVKPTYGLVPLEGVFPVNATYLDVVGPLARSVADAAVALDVLAGATRKDLATYSATGHIPASGYAVGLDTASVAGKRFGLVGPGWRNDWLPLDTMTERLYERATRTMVSLGAQVEDDPFRGSGFVELWEERPGVPDVGDDDILAYLKGLGPGAAFHSIGEWQRLTGRRFDDVHKGSQPDGIASGPVRPGGVEEADAYQAWRAELRALFRRVLAENRLDGLFFPQSAAPNRDLVEDPVRPDFAPNDWPEIPSNIVNALGVPVVTVPAGFFEDGTPFVVAFIGDMWSERELLRDASAFERATRARRAPVLY